jgi:hypothetical protein
VSERSHIMSDAQRFVDYFGDAAPLRIVQAFRADGGWADVDYDATVASVRLLAARGFNAVAVDRGDKVADFTMGEVLVYANRPMFGGRLI